MSELERASREHVLALDEHRLNLENTKATTEQFIASRDRLLASESALRSALAAAQAQEQAVPREPVAYAVTSPEGFTQLYWAHHVDTRLEAQGWRHVALYDAAKP